MRLGEITEKLLDIEDLMCDLNRIAPKEDLSLSEFRSRLAGLLLISVTSTYENCMRDIMVAHADRHNSRFSYYIERELERLNSKVNSHDLFKYTTKFGDSIYKNFKDSINRANKITASNITMKYDQLFKWRHNFAHSGTRVTTIEEVYLFHRYGRLVVYCFARSFTL